MMVQTDPCPQKEIQNPLQKAQTQVGTTTANRKLQRTGTVLILRGPFPAPECQQKQNCSHKNYSARPFHPSVYYIITLPPIAW